MSEKLFVLISVEDVDATQSALIHEAIKTNSTSWWHQQKSTWIVESDETPKAWRDRIRPFLGGVGGNALVLLLPSSQGRRAWAVSSLSAKWLASRYTPKALATLKASDD